MAGPKRTIDLLRYSSNGYIFSTALPPSVVAGIIEAIDILEGDGAYKTDCERTQKGSEMELSLWV